MGYDMPGVRNDINARASVVAGIAPTSTAVLGVDSSAFDTRSYAHGSRFMAVLNTTALTEGTLTPTLVDCDTSGGTYTALADQYGSFVALTSASGAVVQTVGFQPTAGRPFVKIRLTETVSVTTAIGISGEFVALPPAMV